MSGGKFDHTQYHIETIADTIQSYLDKQGTEKPKDDSWHDKEWYIKYPEDKFYGSYSGKTQQHFRDAIHHLRLAKIYAQRIDWFLSGDDGEDTFHERLSEELKKFEGKDTEEEIL